MALPGNMGRRLIGGVVLGMVIYAGFALWVDLDGMRAALADFPLVLLPVAMGLSFLNYVVRFVRWERYRKLLAIDVAPKTSFLIYLSGLALTVTPGKMGETFKSFLLRRVNGTPVHKSAPIVVAERFTDLLGFLLLIAIGGIATQPQYQWVFWATLALCAVLIALAGSVRASGAMLAVAERTPLVRRVAHKVEGSLASTRTLLAPKQIAWPTIVASVGWSLECTGFWLIARALHPGSVQFLYAVYTFALSAVVGAVLILFPGGLGVTEASMGKLLSDRYKLAGVAADAAASMAVSATLLIRLCTLWFAVVVGLIAMALFTKRFGPLESEARAS